MILLVPIDRLIIFSFSVKEFRIGILYCVKEPSMEETLSEHDKDLPQWQ